MTTLLKLRLAPPLLLSGLTLLSLHARAQVTAPAAAPVSAAAPSLAASSPASPPEPQVLHQVIEDDQVRIEELRVRGQTQRIVVQPKIPGMPAYEVVPPTPGKPPSQDPKAGQRVWLTLPLSFL